MLTPEFLKYLNCNVLSTVSQQEDEAQWLKNRTRGIGGSDIGVICGVNSFSTPRILYLTKLGMYNDNEDVSKVMQERRYFGHILEPVVASEFAKREKKLIAVSPATYCSKETPWALANIDRFIVDENGVPTGILECKTSSEYMNSEWFDGELPLMYIYQVLWYMYVTGLRKAYIAALVGGNKFYSYEVLYNEEVVNEVLLPKAKHFWEHNIKNLIEPELDGSEAATEFVKQQYAVCKKNSEKQFTGEDVNEMAGSYVEIVKLIKDLEKSKDEISNRIKEMLGETEIGYTADRVIKWSPRMQTRVDTDRFKSVYPAIYEDCKKIINYRVFTVK